MKTWDGNLENFKSVLVDNFNTYVANFNKFCNWIDNYLFLKNDYEISVNLDFPSVVNRGFYNKLCDLLQIFQQKSSYLESKLNHSSYKNQELDEKGHPIPYDFSIEFDLDLIINKDKYNDLYKRLDENLTAFNLFKNTYGGGN
ncbi:hypothetical protein NYZ94_06355 [Ligilactobacillus salivarius]|uniref:hypothetical protein n=1 Tax=Ligilactobacillus salivarius TaxID=1624 RepID=UPI0017817C51|nr:hypothetical protein [Ligilactobacillus salivarius]MBE7387400.1 hypothetical protein [Ligilactobacillus salivarius]MBE7391794.1 hypothetical protein [Ligilactobacillus salivarius]QXL50022.1 hypothetical protein IGB11_03400 [Ligilactobacillus salivarius]UXI85490.1 hypothetical protein NYZ94_06355 [Ligilactobacillus salivarius]